MFSGHEHLYERLKPQHGVRYFVSGGGGRDLYHFRAGDYDEVGFSEHHFMILEIAGDRLFFEAITQEQKLQDCGVLYRTPDAASKPPRRYDAEVARRVRRRPRPDAPNNAAIV